MARQLAIGVKVLQRLRRRLSVALARDWNLIPTGTHGGGAAAQLFVIASCKMPTIDYYLGDLLAAEMRPRIAYDAEVARWLGRNPPESLAAGTRVILVRTPDSRWAQMLRAAGDRIVEVVWLIDDDIIAAREDDWLPDEYRLRLLDDYLRFRRTFAPLIDRVWASTPLIAARFPTERSEVHPPRPITPNSTRPVTIFYHGTAAHRREHAFLRPIFEQVQARLHHTVIEVTGDHALYRMFRGVPRLRVLHPMPWPDYLAHLHAGNYDIGLVPLLDTPFNRARSGIKALEIASIGAVGVMSRRSPYVEYANLPGMHLVGDGAEEWIDRIVELGSKWSVKAL